MLTKIVEKKLFPSPSEIMTFCVDCVYNYYVINGCLNCTLTLLNNSNGLNFHHKALSDSLAWVYTLSLPVKKYKLVKSEFYEVDWSVLVAGLGRGVPCLASAAQ